MATSAFQGSAMALSSDGMATVAEALHVRNPEIWAVLSVETSGCGYLPDRRPQILYERHIFHRLTNGKFDDGDISDPAPGGYGPRGAPQYDRLNRAILKDRAAALQSASWGLGQIMDTSGVLAKQTIYFTVKANPPTCTLSTADPSVTICSPANNATATSPVTITASTRNSTATVVNMFIWVDGVKQWTGSGSTVNTALPMAKGMRRMTVQARDSSGRYFQSTVYVNVQ